MKASRLDRAYEVAGAASPSSDAAGFTLLELLIAITLTAMLVLVLSMVLRTGFQSWSRSKERNRFLVARTAVEGLLARQLRASFMLFAPKRGGKAGPFGGPTIMKSVLPHGIDAFAGTEHSLVFFTTHVPMGSATGGLFKVAYILDPDDQSLLYAQKIVTAKEDYEADPPQVGDKGNGFEWITDDGWLVNMVDGIGHAAFSYKDQDAEKDEQDPASWDKEFKEARTIPEAVGLGWSRSGDMSSKDEIQWHVIFTNPFPVASLGGLE